MDLYYTIKGLLELARDMTADALIALYAHINPNVGQ